MTASDELLRRNAEQRSPEVLPGEPTQHVVIVTCMDCRIDLHEVFGLRRGEAHVLRNAGGVVTDDVLRSLTISQRKLGTHEIVLMQHTKCGMTTFTESAFKAELEQETGIAPSWSIETFAAPEHGVRQSMNRIRRCPFLGNTTSLRGFVYDVDTGAVLEVD